MHFPVAVITQVQPDAEALRRALQPWHDFDSDGVDDEFVIDVDRTTHLTELLAGWPRLGATIDEIATRWTDYRKKDDGRSYLRTNPNAKWDWWKIGGRWSDSLQLQAGRLANSAAIADLASYPAAPAAVVVEEQWLEPNSSALKDILRGEPPEDWRDRFEAVLAARTGEWITIVDCHI